jgi:hypothetical protein
MRARVVAMVALPVVLLLAGHASGALAAAATPEQVVRAWSEALNANDNEQAARLFAPHARIFQGNLAAELQTHRLAVLFNASLPCAGKIVALRHAGTRVLATFLLGERPQHQCDSPGGKASALFDVRGGKIVLWAQVPNPVPAKPAAKKKQPPQAA